jgi:hypothetical protein
VSEPIVLLAPLARELASFDLNRQLGHVPDQAPHLLVVERQADAVPRNQLDEAPTASAVPVHDQFAIAALRRSR